MEELDMPQAVARGGYAAYRPRRQESGMDPATRRLTMIACGLGGALILLLGVWSLAGRHGGPVPVIQAQSGPVRVKPENPGGLQVAGANDAFLSGDGDQQASALAPPPEQPDPQALNAQQPTPHAAAAPAAATAPAASTGGSALTTMPLAPPSAEPPKSAMAEPPKSAATEPPKAEASATASHADAKPVEMARTAETAAKADAAPDRAQADATRADAAKAGGAEVQLAALGSEQAALAEWQRLSKRLPAMFNGHRPAVSKADVNGRTYWRLRTTGFSDVAQATSFCQAVRAHGGACSIADF